MANSLISSDQDFNAAFASGTPLSVNPGSISDDDQIIIGVIQRVGAANIAISGFTQIDEVDESNFTVALFKKTASSESGAYSITTDGASSHGLALCGVIRGADATLDVTYVQGTHYTNDDNTNTPGAAAITTNTDAAWVVIVNLMRTAAGGTGSYTGPAGYTEIARYAGAAASVLGSMDYIEVDPAATETPDTWDWPGHSSNSDSGSFVIALAPSGGDTTAAVLTLPTLTEGAGGPTEIDFGVTTDTGDSDTLYMYFSTNSSETKADVKDNAFATDTMSTSGAKSYSLEGYPPGVSGYAHFMQEDAAANQSEVVSAGPLRTNHYGAAEVYSGDTIPDNSILHYASGVHDGLANAAELQDSGESWTPDAFIGLIAENRDDNSIALITDNGATTITGTLLQGTENDWDIGDQAEVVASIATNDIMYVESQVTVSSDSFSVKYYLFEDSSSTYTGVETQTYNGTGLTDGEYSVTPNVVGVLTLTAGGLQLISDPISNVISDVVYSPVN